MRAELRGLLGADRAPAVVALRRVLGLCRRGRRPALVLVCLLSHAALIFGTYRLGAAVFGRWPGLLARRVRRRQRVVPALRGARLRRLAVPRARGLGGACSRPRGRGRVALARRCSSLAGLLRPEAWVLAGLYAGWGWRRPAPASGRCCAGAVVVPPLVCGRSSTRRSPATRCTRSTRRPSSPTSSAASAASAHVPGSFVSFIGATVRPPVAAARARSAPCSPGGMLGLARAARAARAVRGRRGRRSSAPGILGLSILPRYLTVPAVALCLFAGYALAGFTTLPAAHPLRRRWAQGSGGRRRARRRRRWRSSRRRSATSRDELRFIRATHDSLVALLDDPRGARGDALRPR